MISGKAGGFTLLSLSRLRLYCFLSGFVKKEKPARTGSGPIRSTPPPPLEGPDRRRALHIPAQPQIALTSLKSLPVCSKPASSRARNSKRRKCGFWRTDGGPKRFSSPRSSASGGGDHLLACFTPAGSPRSRPATPAPRASRSSGKSAERGLGGLGVVGGQVERRLQRAGADDQFAGAAEVGLGLLLPADGPLPERRLARPGAGDGQQQRQGRLAFAEVVAGVLAQGLGRAAVVERVVGELEGQAEVQAVGAQRRDRAPRPRRPTPRRPRRRRRTARRSWR